MDTSKEIITIEATYVECTDKAWYLDCEGDKAWFPKSQVQFNASEKELQCPRWLLEQKFPDEEF